MVMQMNNNSVKNIVIIVIILLIFSGTYVLLKNFTNKKENQDIYLKNYKVNEYINTYITDEEMARIYLNDYIRNMKYDIDKAYDLLDDEYRQEKFGTIENYKKYVNNLKYTSYTLTRYYKQERNDTIIFGVYDNHDNLFIFKTNGVMQYKVYLDDYTVEI